MGQPSTKPVGKINHQEINERLAEIEKKLLADNHQFQERVFNALRAFQGSLDEYKRQLNLCRDSIRHIRTKARDLGLQQLADVVPSMSNQTVARR